MMKGLRLVAEDKTRILPDMTDTHVGTQLSGIYELDERIASGGMGEVYRGHNIQTGDAVALKIVLPEFMRDQTILSLFRKEASILNHLSHDAIVRYHVFTIDPGIRRPYLAMEFVDGKSLFDVMRRGPMAVGDVRKLCHRIASGLSAVHEAGTVHRDLSPDNIILPGGKVERAKIIDFGIARSGKVGGETLIGGRFAGKYNYVSPEQLGLYGGEVTERSDIYSLGLVLAAVRRGKPLDMSGSQFEIVEKRRSIPDLSDIDDDFRPMIEAMLQPDPRNRPASMADIARATVDNTPIGIEETLPPAPPTLHSSPSLVRPTVSARPEGNPPFIPHKPPALSPRPRPLPAPAVRNAAVKRSTTTRNMMIAALTAVAVISGGGAYLGGFLSPRVRPPFSDADETARLTPDLAGPAATKAAAPATQTAERVAQPLSGTDVPLAPPAKKPGVSGRAEQSIQPSDEIANSLAAAAERLKSRANRPDRVNDASKETAPASGAIAEPDTGPATAVAPSRKPPIATNEPAPDVRQPAAVPQTPAEAPSAAEPTKVDNDKAATSSPGTLAARQPPTPEVLAPPVNPPDTNAQKSAENDRQASHSQDEPVVAMNIPKPPPPATDETADRISWLRHYNGGDCFYATATLVRDKAVEIEGFGTTVDPFARMLAAFQAKFHIEPDVSVRLIDPAQCAVTHLLRALGATAAEKPDLVLDRTSVPSGFPVSGTLETRGGLRSSLLLIDNKGMAFNLDERVTVREGKGIFTFPIGPGTPDNAGKPEPHIIIAITGDDDIQAAAFSTPAPAAVVLPRILDEIREKPGAFAATAKYFQLGG